MAALWRISMRLNPSSGPERASTNCSPSRTRSSGAGCRGVRPQEPRWAQVPDPVRYPVEVSGCCRGPGLPPLPLQPPRHPLLPMQQPTHLRRVSCRRSGCLWSSSSPRTRARSRSVCASTSAGSCIFTRTPTSRRWACSSFWSWPQWQIVRQAWGLA